MQVGRLVVDQHRRLEAGDLADRLDELGVIGQERLRVGERGEPVLVDARLRLLGPGLGHCRQHDEGRTERA